MRLSYALLSLSRRRPKPKHSAQRLCRISFDRCSRGRRDWFPEWFSYFMIETEKRIYKNYVEKNPIRWAAENNPHESKDYVPLILPERPKQDKLAAPSTATAVNPSDSPYSTNKSNTKSTTPSSQSYNEAVPKQRLEAECVLSTKPRQSSSHDSASATTLEAVDLFGNGSIVENSQEETTSAALEQASSSAGH